MLQLCEEALSPEHCGGSYRYSSSSFYSPGNWILYVHFFQEDLDAGCASLGIEIVFFFMTNNLKNNLLCDGTYIESRLGEREEKWVRGSEGNLKGQSFLLTYLVNFNA